MDKRSRLLLRIFFALVLLSLIAIFYRNMVARSFRVVYPVSEPAPEDIDIE